MSLRETGQYPVVGSQKRFGYFGGVFTPSILTILGVIMYLRFGWVVGNAGLGGALLIVVISHVISLITALSVSSIATNRTVGTGGAYFMISRSLGGPAGAAIGIPLFLGQALSVAFYVVGFTEAVMVLFPTAPAFVPHAVASGTCVLLTLVSLKSADAALKIQYFIMATIVLSLGSIFLGSSENAPAEITWFNSEGEGFAAVFAVFFPAVTGIMAGVSMSGDLKNARESLPKGTLLAVAGGFVVYMVVPCWLAMNADSQTLIENKNFMFEAALIPSLIYAGVFGATISSALGSILTAPRTLQALAMDGIVPRIFAKGSGPSNEPRAGIIFSFLIAEAGILLGSLDAIAPILTMFFLATYGFTNLACGLERWAATPSFRPSLVVSPFISLTGAFGCFYVMSIIDLPAMIASTALCTGIYLFVQRSALGATYGDARHGIWAAVVRAALQGLRRVDYHPRNWRPNLLVLGGNPEKRSYLLQLGNAIVQERGLVTYFHLLEGKVQDKVQVRADLNERLKEKLQRDFPNVFYRVDVVDEVYRGAVSVSQSYGLGTFEANTVLVGWPNQKDRSREYLQMLRDLTSLDKTVLVLRYDPIRRFGNHREIHIWWGGFRGNGGMMLLLGYLLTAHYKWKNATVHVITVVDRESRVEEVETVLRLVLTNARLSAVPKVLVQGARSVPQVMREESQSADLVIVGMKLPKAGDDDEAYMEKNRSFLDGLPSTVLVKSGRDFDGEPVLMDGND